MLQSLEQNGDQYFMHLASKGVKLPPNFDIKNLVQKREPTPLEVAMQRIQDLEIQMSKLKKE